MTDKEPDEAELEDRPSFIPIEYDAEVGRIARAWAHLEFSVDLVTWELCEIPHEFAACLTAQMFQMQSKIKALIALASVRGFSDEIILELKKFNSKEISALQQKRNRAVHDSRHVHESTGKVNRLQITADGSLTFGMQDEPIDKLRETRKKIEDTIFRFIDIRGRLLAQLPALRDKPPRRFLRIDFDPEA
jgi:hypothetical protein